MTEFMAWFFMLAQDQPALAWSLMWLLWMPYLALEVLLKLVNRVLRTIKVLICGWPPAHLDADGDWKPEAEKELS